MNKLKLNNLNGTILSSSNMEKLRGGGEMGECCCACAEISWSMNGTFNCDRGLKSPGCDTINFQACDGSTVEDPPEGH